MQIKMSIREASIDDLDSLLSLEQHVIEAERPFNKSIKTSDAQYYDIKALIAESDSKLMIAEVDGNIIASGYCQIRKSKQAFLHDKHAYLGFMYVDINYRGQGINRRIIEDLIAWAKSQGINDHYLDVYAQNDRAISAYKKIGFECSMIEMKLNN